MKKKLLFIYTILSLVSFLVAGNFIFSQNQNKKFTTKEEKKVITPLEEKRIETLNEYEIVLKKIANKRAEADMLKKEGEIYLKLSEKETNKANKNKLIAKSNEKIKKAEQLNQEANRLQLRSDSLMKELKKYPNPKKQIKLRSVKEPKPDSRHNFNGSPSYKAKGIVDLDNNNRLYLETWLEKDSATNSDGSYNNNTYYNNKTRYNNDIRGYFGIGIRFGFNGFQFTPPIGENEKDPFNKTNKK